jgi:cytochrome c oxidase subunit 3
MAHAKPNHDYHLIDPSPWPLIGSASAFVMMFGAIVWMRDGLWFGDAIPAWTIFALGTAGLIYTMIGWWADVVKEGQTGAHTPVVQLHLRYGMVLFIASEVMFFVAWFWAYFNLFFWPESHGIAEWPPEGVEVFDPWHLPLYNTVILLLSGTTVTWAHHCLLKGDRKGLKQGLWLTVGLGILFSIVQAYEYTKAAFDFSGNIYGATFFMATGFHGFHVIVGTIFLAVCLMRAYAGHFTPKKHFGFEAAAWYWHFVDVVWLFLFAVIYVWGSHGGALAHH